eukprot:1147357-Pelagomonas_calceolata.AAC.1
MCADLRGADFGVDSFVCTKSIALPWLCVRYNSKHFDEDGLEASLQPLKEKNKKGQCRYKRGRKGED